MLEDELSDQVGCLRSLPDDQNAGEPTDDGSAYRRRGRGLLCILVIGEAVLAADLITQLVFEHLEQNLTAQATSKARIPLI